MDSPYYSKLELCGGAVTVPFLQYLPWQAMHFCRLLITSKFLALELPSHGWKSPEIARDEIWTVCWMFEWGFTNPLFPSQTQNSIQISPQVINGLQHIFKKWVEHCKKCIICQGRYFEKETITTPPQNSGSE
jgi:hypothetical protein